MAESPATSFAAELRSAISERGLSLDSVQRKLEDRGVSIARSTLSYWQTGQRHPSGPRSQRAVAVLESVLGIPDGSLRDTLVPAGSPDVVPVLAMSTIGDVIDEMIAEVGCDGTLAALQWSAFVDIGHLGTAGHVELMHRVQTVRSLGDVDRFPAISAGEVGGSPDLLRHIAVAGCRIGRVARNERHNLCVSELVLDRQLRRGDSHVVRFDVADDNQIEATQCYCLFAAPPLLVVLDLQFHPQRCPVHVEEFERIHDSAPDAVTRPRTLGPDLRVSLVRQRSRRGLVGMRWRWR